MPISSAPQPPPQQADTSRSTADSTPIAICGSDVDDRLAELVMGLSGCDESAAADALSETGTDGDVDRLLWSARALTQLRNRT